MAIAKEQLSPPPGWDREVASLLEALPRGRLSEITGGRSSGATSLLLALLARATARGDLVALVDAEDALEPGAAAAAGADLRSLLWVRGDGRPETALRAAELLVRCPGFALVALDLGDGAGERGRAPGHLAWLRLQRAARDRQAALLLRSARHLAGSAAALVLEVERRGARWVGEPRPTRLEGLAARVRVLHARGVGVRAGGWEVTWRL
jgi:RecA/RadA recombinase